MSANSEDPKVMVIGDITIEDVLIAGSPTIHNSPGGDAIYAAVATNIWNVSVGIAARVGRDFPRQALSRLERAGINTRCLRESDSDTMRFWVLYDKRGGRTFVSQSGDVPLEMSPTLQDLDATWVSGATSRSARHVLHVAGMPFGAARNIIEGLRPHRSNLTILLDSIETWTDDARPTEIMGLASETDVFLPSYIELTAITGCDDPEAACKLLLAAGVETVVAKLGSDGALLCQQGSSPCTVPTARAEVVDTTGAGDSFCGGFAAGLALGDTVEDAVRRANATASASVGGSGSLSLLERAGLAKSLFANQAGTQQPILNNR